MDINRCLLSFCLRQRRSRYIEFAYLDISFCPKKPTNLHPCWKYLLQTFSSCVDGVFVCSAGVPRESLLSNAALEILILSCQDERKLCLASCSCLSARRWEGSSTSIWKSPHVSLYKLNVYSVVPLPSSSSGPNVHLKCWLGHTCFAGGHPIVSVNRFFSIVLLWHVFLLCKWSRSNAGKFAQSVCLSSLSTVTGCASLELSGRLLQNQNHKLNKN